MSRKRPSPRRRKAVPLDLSSAERELLIENTPFLDEWVLERLRLAIVGQAPRFPAEALLQMGDHVDLAAACELDEGIRRRLELIHDRIERTLSAHGLVPPAVQREPQRREARILQFPRSDADHGARAATSPRSSPDARSATKEAAIRVAFSHAQRRKIAAWFPKWADRLRATEPRTLKLPFRRGELVGISHEARRSLDCERTTRERRILQRILDAAEANTRLYRVRITLLGVHPAVWRVARIPDCTLRQLHEYLRALMGWRDDHPYFFHVDGIPVEEDGRRPHRLSDLTGEPFRRLDLLYEYDVDASWTHRVAVEKPLHAKGDDDVACLAGRGACPPEEALDPSDYAELTLAMLDPDHEDHLSALLWTQNFDADRFSVKAATRRIQAVERGAGDPVP